MLISLFDIFLKSITDLAIKVKTQSYELPLASVRLVVGDKQMYHVRISFAFTHNSGVFHDPAIRK